MSLRCRLRRTIAAVVLLTPAPVGLPAQTPIDTALARRIFREAALLTARDAGTLWGMSLAGPLLLVDPSSRQLLSEIPDSAGMLQPLGGLWSGRLPDREPIANSAVRWGGQSWAMIIWPLRSDSLNRQVLLAHELWHRVQGGLGLPSGMPANAHLGGRDGRLWMRLEGRALRVALASSGTRQRKAIEDAVAFRRARRDRFPSSAADERMLELNEGLAEYTGIALAAPTAEERRLLAERRLAILDTASTFERDFAYRTGPAWGILLDQLAPGWRRSLTPDTDLGLAAGAALGIRRAGPASLTERGRAYGYAAVRKEENLRDVARLARAAELERRFRTGPVLELPLAEAKMSFDPGKVEALEALGSVYGMLQLSDRWGILQCDASGGLIAADFTRAIVPAPSDTSGRRLTGPGWVLELLPGWRIAPGARPGDWTLRPPP